MGSTVSLSFTKEEPEKLNSAITIVREFLEYLPNSKIKFDSSGEHPSITIERKNQILICQFYWYRKNSAEFNATSCSFTFKTKNIDDLDFEFTYNSSGSNKWIVDDNLEIQEQIKTLVEYIRKTGRSKTFPTDFLNK